MKKLTIKTKGKTYYIDVNRILYCQASSSYACIYLVDGEVITASFNLSNLQNKLQDWIFMHRVSRSHVVNLRYVSCIHHSDKIVELNNGNEIPFTGTLKELEDTLLGFAQSII